MYDLIIIGGGPGGVAAGVYAARKKIKTLLVTEAIGGQSIVSADIQNWIGRPSVSGFDLAKSLEEHLKLQEGIQVEEGDIVVAVREKNGALEIETREGKKFETRFILLASGSRRRNLGVPGEKEFEGRGVVYCSICDAPLFRDKEVAVVGGGNAGVEAVIDLLPYASKIYLLEYNDHLKADAVTQEKIMKEEKVKTIMKAKTKDILGDDFVSGLRYEDIVSGDVKELAVQGVFVEIGAIPNSDFIKDLVKTNEFGEVVVDHKTQQTSDPRIWAVGDVSDVLYKQNNISAGDAVKALLNIYERIIKG